MISPTVCFRNVTPHCEYTPNNIYKKQPNALEMVPPLCECNTL